MFSYGGTRIARNTETTFLFKIVLLCCSCCRPSGGNTREQEKHNVLSVHRIINNVKHPTKNWIRGQKPPSLETRTMFHFDCFCWWLLFLLLLLLLVSFSLSCWRYCLIWVLPSRSKHHRNGVVCGSRSPTWKQQKKETEILFHSKSGLVFFFGGGGNT